MESIYRNILKELSDNKINYVLLRKPLNWIDTVDLDIIVEIGNNIDIKFYKLGYSKKKGSNTFIRYDFEHKKWIYLDINNPLKFGDYSFGNNLIDELIQTKYIDKEGICRICTSYEALLCLLHSATNKGLISSKYRHLIFGNKLDKSFLIEFSKKLSLYNIYKLLLFLRANPSKERYVIREIRKLFIKRKFDFIASKFKRLKSFLKGPRPIVFLGPDGSGKSTLVSILKDLKLPNIKLIYMGPFSELEMNKVLFESIKIIQNKREKYHKKTFKGFLFRIIWYFLCYVDLTIRIWSNNLFVSAGGILICDRYACDVFFRQPNIFVKLMFLNFFLRPKFVFLCVGNPQKIFNRKPEISVSKISSLISSYRKILNEYDFNYKELNTTDNSIEKIIKEILDELIFEI